jgi:hypothetical protein
MISALMEELIGILEETPLWVYFVFAYLVLMGVKALKPRSVSMKKLFVFPAILTIWGLLGMRWSIYPLLAWSISLVIGFGLGWLLVRTWKIKYDRSRMTMHLPGTRTTLILALVFFAIKYFFGFYKATHIDIPEELMVAQSAASGLITGLFLGRLAFFWTMYESQK